MDKPLVYAWMKSIIQQENKLYLAIKYPRNTRYGDYTFWKKDGVSKITVNNNLTVFFTWLVFLHEFAHYLTKMQNLNKKVLPHGLEWKTNFRKLLEHEILQKKDFYTPEEIIFLKQTWRNPSVKFPYHLMVGEEKKSVLRLKDIAIGEPFVFQKHGEFVKIKKLRVKYLCKSLQNHKEYLIHQDAEVQLK